MKETLLNYTGRAFFIKKNYPPLITHILFEDCIKTKDEKMDETANELNIMNIQEFFKDYISTRVRINVQEAEIKSAIFNTIEEIKKE